MNLIKKIGIACHGYQSANLIDDQAEDLNPIVIIGMSVLFAALIAGINWGAAGWIFSGDAPPDLRLYVTLFAAMIGILLVLIFDRSFLYFVDTQQGKGRIKTFFYALFRVILILMIGSITSQGVMPLLLESELMGHALQMTEEKEKARLQDLSSHHDISGKRGALMQSAQDVDRLDKALSTLPVEIEYQLKAAKDCWRSYNAKKKRLINKGVTKKGARDALSRKAASCAQTENVANEQRNSYLSRIRGQLSQATANKQAQEAALLDANQKVRVRVEMAHGIETKAFNSRSSTVLWNLISTNPGVLAKWALITAVLMMLELLPLLLKLQASRSLIGHRIALDREHRILKMEEKRQQLKQGVRIDSAVNATAMAAIGEALNSPAVQAEFLRVFTANLSALAPLESVQTMMREMETHLDHHDFMRRFPRYASVIAQAWSQALHQTTEILKRGIQPGQMQPEPAV